MNRISLLLLMIVSLLTACSGGYHPEYFGDYYLCYRDGKVLTENDSVHQVYIRLNADHTFQVKDYKSIEQGRWKTKDYDDFSITYFYTSYTDYFLDSSAGETFVKGTPHDKNTNVFSSPNWNDEGKMAPLASHQALFCSQGKILTQAQLKEVLMNTYGANLKRSN